MICRDSCSHLVLISISPFLMMDLQKSSSMLFKSLVRIMMPSPPVNVLITSMRFLIAVSIF